MIRFFLGILFRLNQLHCPKSQNIYREAEFFMELYSLSRFFQKTALGLFLSLIFGLTSVFGFDVPSYTGWVNDQADVLSESEEKILTQQIESIEAQTTAEIAILTVPTIGDISKNQYATQVAQTWGVGKDDTDNGILVLVAVDDRQWFMATGYGVEGSLPDLRVQQIGEKNFPTAFRQQQYAQGLTQALTDINGFLVQDESIISAYEKKSAPLFDLFIPQWGWLLIHFFATIFVTILAFRRNKSNSFEEPKYILYRFLTMGAVLIFWGLGFLYLIFFFVSFIHALNGSRNATVSDTGYVSGGWTSGGGGFGDGGFGGFGDGGFGGGGFGGDW
jgi:uncharacterized protein